MFNHVVHFHISSACKFKSSDSVNCCGRQLTEIFLNCFLSDLFKLNLQQNFTTSKRLLFYV
jgi:hypothetical protein